MATNHERTYERVYVLVREIPSGKVATYGQIAAMVGNCTARMVGYALAAVGGKGDVPWQRVINAQGKISLRANSGSTNLQRILLEEEGVTFDNNGRVNLKAYRWSGPAIAWLLENGFDPMPTWEAE